MHKALLDKGGATCYAGVTNCRKDGIYEEKNEGARPAAWLRENKWTCIVLAAALAVLLAARLLAAPVPVQSDEPENRADYESASVDQILSDSTEKDPASDNGYRGEQLLLVTVRSGDYKGQQMQVYNYVGPLYGGPLKVGDRATVLISTYSDGTVNATVYESTVCCPFASCWCCSSRQRWPWAAGRGSNPWWPWR